MFKLKDVAMCALSSLFDLHSPIFEDFFKNDQIYLFEGDKFSRVAHGSGLECTIARLEEKHNIKIYAVTHDFLDFGEMYSFLCVSHYEEDWEHMVRRIGKDEYMAYAYVENVQDDLCSEFGYVALSTVGGLLKRVG